MIKVFIMALILPSGGMHYDTNYTYRDYEHCSRVAEMLIKKTGYPYPWLCGWVLKEAP